MSTNISMTISTSTTSNTCSTMLVLLPPSQAVSAFQEFKKVHSEKQKKTSRKLESPEIAVSLSFRKRGKRYRQLHPGLTFFMVLLPILHRDSSSG